MRKEITTQLAETKSIAESNKKRERELYVRQRDIEERERNFYKINKRLKQKQEDSEEDREKWEIELRRRIQAEAGREIRSLRMELEKQKINIVKNYKKTILKWRLATGLLAASNIVAIICIFLF